MKDNQEEKNVILVGLDNSYSRHAELLLLETLLKKDKDAKAPICVFQTRQEQELENKKELFKELTLTLKAQEGEVIDLPTSFKDDRKEARKGWKDPFGRKNKNKFRS